MNNDELLGKIAEFLNPIAKDISQIKTELLHLKSAVDALKSGQDDLRDGQQNIREALAQKADKADIHRVEQKLDKSNKHLQDHEARIEALEEEQHSTTRINSSCAVRLTLLYILPLAGHFFYPLKQDTSVRQ